MRSGSATAPPPARLIVIAQDGTPGREYPIEGGTLEIGRESGHIVLREDPYVCPNHARIFFDAGRFQLRNQSAVNGVYVRLTATTPLQDGDLVLAGLQVLRFETVPTNEQNLGQAVENGTRVFGSPAAPRLARLVQRTVEGGSRNIFYIHKTETTVGRETGDIVFTEDPFMSRQHAMISQVSQGAFTLSDLNSSNGTFLGLRGDRTLNDGDQLRIGQHLFQLRIG